MKKLFLFSCLFIALAVQAQKEKGEAYVAMYKELAITEMMRTGVPAAITLAQGILESQFGESDLVKNSNNHFGIKCKTEWTGPKTYHDDDEKGECFRVYATAADSYKDHSDFLKTRPNYAFLFKLDPRDYDGWAKGLKKAGYATSPVYPQKLLKVIDDYNLQRYSLEALARSENPSPANTPVIIESAVVKEEVTRRTDAASNPIEKTTQDPTAVKEEPASAATVQEPVTTKIKKTNSYPSGIFSINHAKVVYAMEGKSLLSLANQYDIPLSKLIEFNDLAEMDVLDMDRLIFIEKKLKKGANDFHLVATGETLHDICQQEGVRLDSLMEYNHLAKTTVLSSGNKIYLHPATAAVPATSKSPK